MPDRKPQELFAISCKANIMGRMELVCFGMYRYEKKRKIHAQKKVVAIWAQLHIRTPLLLLMTNHEETRLKVLP